MARMRTLKPEAATSESLARVPPGYRWTFAMFWTHCDDEGRAVWNLRLIKAAIYPLDDDKTPDVLGREFAGLEQIGAVCRYEVDGREYVHVPAFGDHQHPNRRVDSKLPPCPKTDHSMPAHTQRSEPAVSAHEGVTPVVVVGVVDVEEREGLADRGQIADAARPPATPTLNVRAQALTTAYVDQVPMSKFPAILGIVKKAMTAGHPDDRIESALLRLAAEGRSVTVETLRIELEGAPPGRAAMRRGTDDKVRDGLALAQRLAEEANSRPRQIGA